MLAATVCGALLQAQSVEVTPASNEADALYVKREDPASARRAAEIWAAVQRDPKDFEAARTAARGTHRT
jgi:hypothetical protein